METDDDDPPLVKIRADGDVLLQAKGSSGKIIGHYRVSSTVLKDTSRYYERLLASTFNEGLKFRDGQEQLQRKYRDLKKAKVSELPTIAIPLPEGIIDEEVMLAAMNILLRAMHQDTSLPQYQEDREFLLHALSSDINQLAHVCAVADQLDASEAIQFVVDEVLAVQPMCQKKPKKDDADSERYWRQLLYIAYIHKHSKAFLWISGTIILHGLEDHDSRNLDAPWHNLSNNVQEEIAIRREGIFSTISSVPNSLLKPYMQADKSKTLLCKMGYDSSVSCDSFQLGESIRWLCRRKLVSPNLAMFFAVPEDETFIPDGTPKAMIAALREFPDYQIDKFHARCGIRGKLILILHQLEKMLSDVKQIGICLQCWNSKDRDKISWSMDKRSNTGPYKGNLAKDLQAIQQLRIENASSSSVSRATAKAIYEVPSDSVCLLAHDHTLYAKVFAPEKWIEKIWLTGDETMLEVNTPRNTSYAPSLRR